MKGDRDRDRSFSILLHKEGSITVGVEEGLIQMVSQKKQHIRWI